jgi:hypothetical protein
MAITRFAVALLISVAAATCGSAEIPPSVESVLLRRLDAEKIIEVHDLRQRTIGEFDYLGLFATFEVNSAFERWYHPQVILRKKTLRSQLVAGRILSLWEGAGRSVRVT